MIAAIKDHQNKAQGLAQALLQVGWDVIYAGSGSADVLLIDHDIDRPGYRDLIDAYKTDGAKIVLYPHGANPMTVWDGLMEPYPVDACLVIAEGHRQVMEAYGYPHPIRVIGWPYGPQHDFQPAAPDRVLFAPIHPLGNGYLHPSWAEANATAFRALLDYGRPITVRLIGSVQANGLWYAPGAEYVAGRMDGSTDGLDDADVVVAHGTFLSLAVAAGKPAVTFHQVQPTSDPEGPGEPLVPVRSWERYRHLMRYPFDLADPDGIAKAAWWAPAQWRRRFIGDPLDPALLDHTLREIVTMAVPA